MKRISKYDIRNRQDLKLANRRFVHKIRRKKRHKGVASGSKNHRMLSGGFNYSPIRQVNEVVAPPDFRLIENLSNCLIFFSKIQDPINFNKYFSQRYIKISLASIQNIDYASICILMAICNDLRAKKIGVRGLLPRDGECFNLIAKSGFLQHVVDFNGNKYDIPTTSQLVFFEKSTSTLSESDSQRISLLIRQVVQYLSNVNKPCMPLKTLILEICGNSLEWSKEKNSQWLLGVAYKEDGKVVFTTTDIGCGILKSLMRKFSKQYFDNFVSRSDEILFRAFCQKYESKSQEENRNNGLPYIREVSEQGGIINLKCLSNDAFLDFNDCNKSQKLMGVSFNGTFYQWEMDINSLTKINKMKLWN